MTRFSTLLLPLIALLLSSCGTAFQKPWQAAIAKPTPNNSIEGPWEGYWKSTVSGHTGRLRCLVSSEHAGQRDFYYHATWGHGLFRGSFKAAHAVSDKTGQTRFTASRDIDRHGFFQAEGYLTPTQFSATYQAAGDRGVFELKRP
jgi:hypothetical protein